MGNLHLTYGKLYIISLALKHLSAYHTVHLTDLLLIRAACHYGNPVSEPLRNAVALLIRPPRGGEIRVFKQCRLSEYIPVISPGPVSADGALYSRIILESVGSLKTSLSDHSRNLKSIERIIIGKHTAGGKVKGERPISVPAEILNLTLFHPAPSVAGKGIAHFLTLDLLELLIKLRFYGILFPRYQACGIRRSKSSRKGRRHKVTLWILQLARGYEELALVSLKCPVSVYLLDRKIIPVQGACGRKLRQGKFDDPAAGAGKHHRIVELGHRKRRRIHINPVPHLIIILSRQILIKPHQHILMILLNSLMITLAVVADPEYPCLRAVGLLFLVLHEKAVLIKKLFVVYIPARILGRAHRPA